MKKELKGFIVGICFTTIAITSISLAFGQDKNKSKKIEANLSNCGLKSNGKSMKINTISYDKKTYIPVNDISEILQREIFWDESTNTLNISDKNMLVPNIQNNINNQNQNSSKQTLKGGTIQGSITYNNDNSQIKPDNHSKLLLIPKNINKNDLNVNDIYLFSNGRDFDKFTSKNIYAATADENGKYKIDGINDGKYILITISKNTQRKFNCINLKSISEPIDASTIALLKPLAESIDVSTDELVTLLSRFSKFSIKEAEINNNSLEIDSNFTLSK